MITQVPKMNYELHTTYYEMHTILMNQAYTLRYNMPVKDEKQLQRSVSLVHWTERKGNQDFTHCCIYQIDGNFQ